MDMSNKFGIYLLLSMLALLSTFCLSTLRVGGHNCAHSLNLQEFPYPFVSHEGIADCLIIVGDSSRGGDLVVKTKAKNDRVEIEIQDTGCGIPKERLRTIFEDYVTTKRKGLGLGLAICKKIVQDLNGTIEVESEPGKGTTFTLKFPLL